MPLRRLLTRLFTHQMQGTEPQIVELEEPICILGISTHTDSKHAARAVSDLGKQYGSYKQSHEIPNRKQPWAFAAVSKGYDPKTGRFWYLMGDVVTKLADIPKGLEAFEIPPGTYAVFPVRPKGQFGWGVAIPNAKRYAFQTWLPSSDYEAAGTIDDFEYHDERSIHKTEPEIDLYIAIRPKP